MRINNYKLIDFVNHVFIVVHNEDTSLLENALQYEGFTSTIVKTEYTEVEKKYSKQSRCLLNHSNAWKQCSIRNDFSIIVEADFVPVIGLGQLPMPFDPKEKSNSCAWLYSGSSRLWTLKDNKYPIGFTSTNVAILISSEVAKVLVKFAEEEFNSKDPREYFPWDTYHWSYLVKNKINPYLPYRSYGEHGGLSNPEHSQAGINPAHQADVLWGKLYFLPLYAKGSYLKYSYTRIRAKLRGIARLFLGKYLPVQRLISNNHQKEEKIPKFKMLIFSIKRLLCIY